MLMTRAKLKTDIIDQLRLSRVLTSQSFRLIVFLQSRMHKNQAYGTVWFQIKWFQIFFLQIRGSQHVNI